MKQARGFMASIIKGDTGASHIITETAKQVVGGLFGKKELNRVYDGSLRYALASLWSLIRGINIIGYHVSKTNRDCLPALHAVHQGDLPLLSMTDGMGHHPQARVAPLAKLQIRHRDRTHMMPGHQIDKVPIERHRIYRPKPFNCSRVEQAGH
jgi:hypothetical protein